MLLTCHIVSALALFFGGIALWAGRKGGLSPKGRRLSLICCLAFGLYLSIALYVFLYSRNADKKYARYITCLNNLKQLGFAIQLYAQDNNGCLPPNDGWQNALQDYCFGLNAIACPSAPSNKTSYVYLGDNEMTLPAAELAQRIPLFHESMCFHPEHCNDKILVCFMDGDVQPLSKCELKEAISLGKSFSTIQQGTANGSHLAQLPASQEEAKCHGIQKIVYIETGFTGPTEKYMIDLVTENIIYEINLGRGSKEVERTELPLEYVRKIKVLLSGFSVDNWKERFFDAQIHDGIQWKLDVFFADGSSRMISGSNSWPKDFYRLHLNEIKKEAKKAGKKNMR